MYWIWANEPTGDGESMLYGVPPVIETLDLSFDRGVPVEIEVPVVEIERDEDSGGALTDNLIAPGVRGLLLSSRLRSILTGVGVDNLVYYPCRISDRGDGTTTEDYALANVVGKVSCLDTENSDLQFHPSFAEQVEFIDTLALNPGVCTGLKMFRMEEVTQIILVDEGVKRACEAANVTGVRFYAPPEFSF